MNKIKEKLENMKNLSFVPNAKTNYYRPVIFSLLNIKKNINRGFFSSVSLEKSISY